MNIPVQIKSVRQGLGWSQSKLGEESGMGQASISRLESKEQDVKISTLETIAGCMGHELVVEFRRK